MSRKEPSLKSTLETMRDNLRHWAELWPNVKDAWDTYQVFKRRKGELRRAKILDPKNADERAMTLQVDRRKARPAFRVVKDYVWTVKAITEDADVIASEAEKAGIVSTPLLLFANEPNEQYFQEAFAVVERLRVKLHDEQPDEGAKYSEEDVPAEYREGGKLDGAVLTAPYLKDESDWELPGPYLSKHYGPDKTLTTHIKVGRAKAYLYKELAALRRNKTDPPPPTEKEIEARRDAIRKGKG
jgi:hypothetical protein